MKEVEYVNIPMLYYATNEIANIEFKLFLYLLMNRDKETNAVYFTVNELMNETSKSRATIYKALRKLLNMNALIKKNGRYYINKKIFA